MRVYVVEASAKGGMIHYDYCLCRALQQAGVETTLVTSTDYELRDFEHNFRVVELLRLWDPRAPRPGSAWLWRLRRGTRGLLYMREWIRLILFLRRERPDVVLFGEMRFAFEYYFLRVLNTLGLRLAAIVHDVHTYDRSADTGVITRSSEQHIHAFERMYRQFFALFVHDRTNYDLFLKLFSIPADRVHQIPHARIDIAFQAQPTLSADTLRDKLSIPPDVPVVLFFGAITKYKGVDVLIRAFARVRDSTRAWLVITGFPTKEISADSLRQIASESGVSDRVAWYLDYVPNEWVTPLMNMSDVVVLPYRLVAQSGVLQHAYAHAKPVVATRVGALPDAIDDGQSGLLVPPEDPDALANAIIQILDNPELAQRMGIYAQHLSETRHSWKLVTDRMQAAFGADQPR